LKIQAANVNETYATPMALLCKICGEKAALTEASKNYRFGKLAKYSIKTNGYKQM
jgi:hypothetical protein